MMLSARENSAKHDSDVLRSGGLFCYNFPIHPCVINNVAILSFCLSACVLYYPSIASVFPYFYR